ncbi:MAG TPA: outer membrane protein assembly factor BamE [Burkholderiales bacterium]|jgi:outer membrane protein assembly factor BamE|nr:outer membrane protein assembly factor BamE [Burkholderiales bacterium]
MNRAACLCLASAALLSACSYMPRIPGVTPYRIDIQQGNYVSQEMVSQLKPGMTKEQVQATLGTPLLTDVFHADRWDYIYTLDAADGRKEQRKLTAYFKEGKLTRVDGDVVPAAPKEASK